VAGLAATPFVGGKPTRTAGALAPRNGSGAAAMIFLAIRSRRFLIECGCCRRGRPRGAEGRSAGSHAALARRP
jgi:hypothetical protein